MGSPKGLPIFCEIFTYKDIAWTADISIKGKNIRQPSDPGYGAALKGYRRGDGKRKEETGKKEGKMNNIF